MFFEESHRAIGACALKYGVKQLYCYGKETAATAQAFGTNAYFYDDQTQLIAALKPRLTPEVTVLVKGSNSMKMNNIVAALCHP